MTIEQLSQPRSTAPALSQQTAVEQARAVAEVAAAVRVAQDFPRDTTKALDQMREACRQKALAQRAFYSLPRAGGRVEGSTVHLARELARCWGNVDYGLRELSRDDIKGESEIQAWAWDQETNVRSVRSFIVPHARMVGSAKKGDKRRERLDDLGDITNNNNSVGARAVRETIFTILPVWFRDEAEQIATATLQDGGGKSLAQRVSDAIAYFETTYRVRKEQLEARLDRPSGEWTAQDLGVLTLIIGELGRGEKRVEDEFPTAKPSPATVTADEIKGSEPTDPALVEDNFTADEGVRS